MKTLLAKSYRLNRFHAAIVMVLIAVLVWFMLRYFAVIGASVEQLVFYNNIQLIHRFLEIERHLHSGTENKCSLLYDPTWLQKTMPGASRSTIAMTKIPAVIEDAWSFDAAHNILTYKVSNTRYFRAASQDKILIYFYCQNGRIESAMSPHQWCFDKRFWGCEKWSKK